VSIRGTVIRVSNILTYTISFKLNLTSTNIKPLVTEMAFDCKCEAHFVRKLIDGKFNTPTKCETNGCRSKIFEPDKRTAVTVDWQKIRLDFESLW
jgi:DNA replicative helicase MCM subunit Mcm2 (Cdc46/Mcm family)